MKHQKRRNQNERSKRARKFGETRIVVRDGTINRPPDISGTYQIPRPLYVKQQVQRRPFTISIPLTSTAAAIYQIIAMYAPFGLTSPGNTLSFIQAPASFSNMLNCYGAYRVRRIQLIFESLLASMSAVVPTPYVVAMVPDYATLSPGTPTALALQDYQNNTKVSPLAPAELTYKIPHIASGFAANDAVFSGGWILSESYQNFATSGSIIVTQDAGFTASAPYSRLTISYEIEFKNPL